MHAGGDGGFTQGAWTVGVDAQALTTNGNISTQSFIFSSRIFPRVSGIKCSDITLAYLHISNCHVRQLQLTGFFIALRFVGNG
ncbi:hypothetical protein MMN81_27810, partial [Escherichia coli]|nr:hypothetical protein [Escherichia coli]